MRPTPTPHHRGHQHQLGGLRKRKERFANRLGRLLGNRGPALCTVGRSDSRVEQAEVVVDLSNRGNGTAGARGARLLIDGKGRRQAIDRIDIGASDLF